MAKLVQVNTKIEMAKFAYQWNIENFRFSCKRPVGKAINSPIFSIPNTKVKGCLKVYPGGVKEDYKNYVSVYLELKNYEDADLVGTFDLWIPEIEGSIKNSGLVDFSLEESFGYPKYISREYVLKSENNVLVDEKLTFMCDISINRGVIESSYMAHSDDIIESVESSLAEDFKRLLDERTHTDVTLKIGENRFEAHKIVLMARSKTFKQSFTNLSDLTEIEIFNVPTELMADFLRYIYTDKVNVAGLKLMAFWKVAGQYHLQNTKLQVQCEKELIAQISNENVVELYKFGFEQNFKKLCDQCFSHIVADFETTGDVEGYENLLKSKFPGIGNEILDRVLNGLIASIKNKS